MDDQCKINASWNMYTAKSYESRIVESCQMGHALVDCLFGPFASHERKLAMLKDKMKSWLRPITYDIPV